MQNEFPQTIKIAVAAQSELPSIQVDKAAQYGGGVIVFIIVLTALVRALTALISPPKE